MKRQDLQLVKSWIWMKPDCFLVEGSIPVMKKLILFWSLKRINKEEKKRVLVSCLSYLLWLQYFGCHLLVTIPIPKLNGTVVTHWDIGG